MDTTLNPSQLEDEGNDALHSEILEILDNHAGKLSTKEELCDMIENDIIKPAGYVSIDYHDIYTTLTGVAELDGVKVAGARNEFEQLLNDVTARLQAAHDGATLTKILIHLTAGNDANIQIEELQPMRELIAQFNDNVQVVWGFSTDNNQDANIIKICLLAGFN